MDAVSVGLVFAVVAASYATVQASIAKLERRTSRVERKLDLILTNLGVDFVDDFPALSERVKELARAPGGKIAAIKAYREETSSGLKEAKEAVEEFLDASRDRPSA
jgi:ribosomal protein L7/L12